MGLFTGVRLPQQAHEEGSPRFRHFHHMGLSVLREFRSPDVAHFPGHKFFIDCVCTVVIYSSHQAHLDVFFHLYVIYILLLDVLNLYVIILPPLVMVEHGGLKQAQFVAQDPLELVSLPHLVNPPSCQKMGVGLNQTHGS